MNRFRSQRGQAMVLTCLFITALLGIAAFALPTSILGAGFLAELDGSKRQTCPRCGGAP